MKIRKVSLTALAVLLLCGAWSGLALAIGSHLPAARSEYERVVVGTSHRWRSAFPLHVAQDNPCTGDWLALDALLVLDVKARLEGQDAIVIVTAVLDARPGPDGAPGVVTTRELYGYFTPGYATEMYTHDFRAPLAGHPVPGELVIPLQQGLDPAGLLTIEPGEARVACP